MIFENSPVDTQERRIFQNRVCSRHKDDLERAASANTGRSIEQVAKRKRSWYYLCIS